MKDATVSEETLSMSSADIGEAESREVIEVLQSGRLALGPKTEAFERALADYVGARHGIAVSSGTAALHLIVRSLGIGPGDEVIVPSFTFAASANAVLFEGATPVFADIEPETLTLDPEDVDAKLTAKTRAIMPVDVFGHPVDWDALRMIAARRDLALIDDSCEALGASWRGRKIGGLGTAATFGFYPNKQITTGEGGMVVTNDDTIADLCRSMRNQGRGKMGAWLEHERLGYNYRIDELSAAVGLVQMRRIDEILGRRRRVAELYNQRLAGVEGIELPRANRHAEVSWFVYVIRVAEGIDRDAVMRRLAEAGVPSRAYFEPIHTQPYIVERFGPPAAPLPVTEREARRTIALPFHNFLDVDQVDRVATELEAALDR